MSQHDDNVKRFGELMYHAGKRGIPFEDALESADEMVPTVFRGKLSGGPLNPVETVDFREIHGIKERYEQGLREFNANPGTNDQ